MNWACKLTQDAAGDLKDLARDVQERVARAISTMEADPFRGDVKALKGKAWKGLFRRRLGSYRIIFTADQRQKTVAIVSILLRSGKTYR